MSTHQPLTEVINEVIDFCDYLPDAPTYEDCIWQDRNRLLAAYIREAPNDISEVLFHIEDTANPFEFADALETGSEMGFAIIKVAAEKAFESAINDCIMDQFNDFCDSNGLYSSGRRHEPAELIGLDLRDHDSENKARGL